MKKMKMIALLMAVALMVSNVQLDAVAAESVVSEETREPIEVSEADELQENLKTEEEKEIIAADEADTDDDNQNDSQDIEGNSGETTEMEPQEGTKPETVENGQQEETQAGTITSESSEEAQAGATEEEKPEDAQAGAAEAETPEDAQAGETEKETSGDAQAGETEKETSEEEQAENTEEEVTEESQTENTDEDSQEETPEDAYAMQLNGEEEAYAVENERKFALKDGSADITSGKFGAVLAYVTLPEKMDGINNEDYVEILNPRITGAVGNAKAYFKNLRLIAENKEDNTDGKYQLVGDVKAEAPIATYTVTMTADGKSDTATFAIVEKGIERLKIKGVPSVVSSERKVSIKPILEINGDSTGKDKAATPKNKKMAWEIVSVEGKTAPSSLKMNKQNGAVTVNAGDNGAFRIKVTTTDSKYTDADGNPVSFTSEIVEVVSGNDQRLESLAGCAIVLVDNSDPAEAKLLNKDGKTADMSSLDGTKAYVKIQKADGTFVDAENYVIKANNKAFRIAADTSVACVLTKPIKSGKTLTVTLSATLVNGKKEQALKGKITIKSALEGEQDLSLALGVSGTDRADLKNDGKTLEFTGSASTLIKMELKKNGNPVGSPASYNLKFKNLKKVSEVISKDSIVVYATLRTASGTVTLTDCSTGKKTTYEVKNTEKSTTAGKSPTIKQRTNPASNTGPDYKITAKGKAVTDYTHVRVEPIPTDYIKSCKTRKAQGKYRAFASALGLDPYGSDKSFTLCEVDSEDNTFRIPFVKAEQPAKGSYKLQMTVGKMKDGQFMATAAPVIVTTKVSGKRAKPENDTDSVKVLVAYFSATNTTKGVAKKLADGLDADIYEIVPKVPYTSADLNYNNPDSRANKEQNDPNSRPEISGSVENMEQYDIVFIGYPIWWGQAPKIMYTFMESYDFSGKTIVPFCTSGSSSIGSSATNLEKLTSGAVWKSGTRFSGSASQNTIMEWVRGLGLNLGE